MVWLCEKRHVSKYADSLIVGINNGVSARVGREYQATKKRWLKITPLFLCKRLIKVKCLHRQKISQHYKNYDSNCANIHQTELFIEIHPPRGKNAKKQKKAQEALRKKALALKDMINNGILKTIEENVATGTINRYDAYVLAGLVDKLYVHLYGNVEEFKKGDNSRQIIGKCVYICWKSPNFMLR